MKILAWFLNHTKAGKIVKSIQEWLDGKKQIIASLATALPATLLIIKNFTDQGLPYLLSIAHTPEFSAAALGWIGLFNAIKGNKIIAAVNAPVVEPPKSE